MAKKYVLLPGGAGYIGSHTVVELLQTDEYIPVVVDNLYNSSEEALVRIEKITGEKVVCVCVHVPCMLCLCVFMVLPI